MSVLFYALLLAATVICLSLLAQMIKTKRRKERFKGLELKPNCLLTRYPIAFLSGPRSLFRFNDHWNDVPLFLREHGYEVFAIEPAGRTCQERALSTAGAISSYGKCHLIADASLESELELIAERSIPTLISLTVVRNPERSSQTSSRVSSRNSSKPSLADFKPRKLALEIFEISEPGFERARPSPLEISMRLLLKCHNYAIRKKSAAVDALETAELGLFRGFRNEERFLTLAVSLAERDLTAGDLT